MAQTIYKNPLTLSKDIQENEFDPDSMDVNNPEHREKLVNFYLTDMWGYTPKEIASFEDGDIDESVNGIYNNVNLWDMKKVWSPKEIRDYIVKIKKGY